MATPSAKRLTAVCVVCFRTMATPSTKRKTTVCVVCFLFLFVQNCGHAISKGKKHSVRCMFFCFCFFRTVATPSTQRKSTVCVVCFLFVQNRGYTINTEKDHSVCCMFFVCSEPWPHHQHRERPQCVLYVFCLFRTVATPSTQRKTTVCVVCFLFLFLQNCGHTINKEKEHSVRCIFFVFVSSELWPHPQRRG